MGTIASDTVRSTRVDFAVVKAGHDLRRIVGLARGSKTRCPFHGGGRERTPSCHIYPDHYFCFGCGATGDVIDWVATRDGVSRVEAARRLGGIGGARPIRRIASKPAAPPPRTPTESRRPPEPGTLEALLAKLAGRGIRLDGRLVHPWIGVGTVTGRVVYRDPALQTLPRADRLRRLGPVVTGRRFVRADYGQIEPRILLAILRRRGLIAWDAGDDLYRDLIANSAVDRDAVKVAVNRVINGGRPEPGATGRLAEFIAAAAAYRTELASGAQSAGCVRTLAGRAIPLAADEGNFGGKAVNRLVQGTAADIFHRAAVDVDRAIEDARLPAAVAFLLFDELWIECGPAEVAEIAGLVRTEMEGAAAAEGIVIPARIDDTPAPGAVPSPSAPGTTGAGSRSSPSPAPAVPERGAWRIPAWQATIDAVVRRGERLLRDRAGEGREVLRWLRARGLADATISRFRLGFNPADVWTGPVAGLLDAEGRPRRLYLPRGVTIPWARPGAWYASGRGPDGARPGHRWVCLTARRLAEDVHSPLLGGINKYLAVAGSVRGCLYPWPEILPSQGRLPALIVEGELDALVGWQDLGHLAHVHTVGSAAVRRLPGPSRAALARCPWWLLAFDHDAAGVEAARRWKALAPHKARRVLLPSGKDLSEFVIGGGDPVRWLQEYLGKLEPRPAPGTCDFSK